MLPLSVLQLREGSLPVSEEASGPSSTEQLSLAIVAA
jgi:hypothetical protein